MTVHSQLKSASAVAAKLGAVALVVATLSACVIAPLGHGHHGRGYGGPVAVEVAPVVVAPPPPVVVMPPAPRYGYPRYYRY
jgi:hypothetical protein